MNADNNDNKFVWLADGSSETTLRQHVEELVSVHFSASHCLSDSSCGAITATYSHPSPAEQLHDALC